MNIFFAECIGTLLLVLLGNGAVANVLLKESKGHQGGWIVISSAWGVAVSLAIYVSGWVSDAHINPAVTLAFAIVRNISWSLVPAYLLGQFLGGFLGALLVYATYRDHYLVEENGTAKLLTFCTKPAIDSPFWNFVTEFIATFILLFAVLGITDPHNDLGKGFSPYLIGMVVFSIGLSLGGPTGYAINPARDLSPRLAHSFLFGFKHSSWGYFWIPLFGPILGGILGALSYRLLF